MASTTEVRRRQRFSPAAAELPCGTPGPFMIVLVIMVFLAGGAGLARSETYRDALGREVELAAPVRRIVSLAPNITEILFALGLDEEIAGVTTFCDWPAAAREKPKVGGFVNPSIEAVVALSPDLVLATADGNSERDVRGIAKMGIPVFVTDSGSYADIVATVRSIGRLTDREERAAGIADAMAARKRRIEEAVGGRERPGVLVVLDSAPLIAAGAKTFIDEMVTSAGGRNVLAAGGVKYPVLSGEALLVADPEVIVDYSGPMTGMEGRRRFMDAFDVSAMRAVREGRLYEIRESDFFLPGPRIADALEELAAMIHPGALP